MNYRKEIPLTGAEINKREFMKNYTLEQIEAIKKEIKLKMGREKTIRCLEEIIRNLKEDRIYHHSKSGYFKWCRYFPAKGKRGLLVKVIN